MVNKFPVNILLCQKMNKYKSHLYDIIEFSVSSHLKHVLNDT